jgi:hypothetical protein
MHVEVSPHLAFKAPVAPGALEARAAFASLIFFLSASLMLLAAPPATPLDKSATEPRLSSPAFADADGTAAPPKETDLCFFSSAATGTPAAT